MADPKAAPVEAVDKVEPVAPVTDSSASLHRDAVPASGARLDTAAPATVPDGSTFTFKPHNGDAITGNITRVENRNILTTNKGDTYDVVGSDNGTVLTPVTRVDGKFQPKTSAMGRTEAIVVPNDKVTMSNPVNAGSDLHVKFTKSTGEVVPVNNRMQPEAAPLVLKSDTAPRLDIVGTMPRALVESSSVVPTIKSDAIIKGSELPGYLRRDLGLHRGDSIPFDKIPVEKQAILNDAVASGRVRLPSESVAFTAAPAVTPFKYPVGFKADTPMLTGGVDVSVPKGDPYLKGFHNPPAFVTTPEFANFKRDNPDLSGRDLVKGFFVQQRTEYLAQHPSIEGFNQKMFGENFPGLPGRRLGEGGDFVMRDPTKMPGFDIGGGDKMHRNMIEFWKGIQGMKPGDSLNGLLDLMNGRMNGKDIMRLSDFLTGQLGRKGSDALGMQDIMNLSTLFRGFGDRAGLSMQFGDNRSGLMMSFGLNGRFDFQIRFGALTLGFGDSRQSGLQQIGNLLFSQEGRLTQNALGTSGLRVSDILSRGFTGQATGQWNPFGPSTGDGALRTTQLTARLTQGNQDFISQMRDNSARLTQQLDASKLAQMSKMPGLLPGDLKPGQLDPGGKNLIQQNFDPLRQDIGKLQPGQKLDGPKILTGNIEMDARTMDGMGGRRGPLTAAAHEAAMKGDLQNQHAKGDQMLPGAKLPGEKLTAEEEAAKKRLEEDKKKGDVRSGEQFIQDEEERKAKERREREEEDREEELEALNEQDEAKRRALLLILEARRKREKELKEKALKDQITKQEEAKRAQYRVAIGDSLENIATKQLRNPRLAGLIFDINRKVVPIKFMNGKEVAVLNVGAILSLPSVKEIKDFSQAGFTLGPKFNKVDFTMPAVSQQGKSAEDELEAMFGSNWHGTDDGAGQSDQSQNVPQNGKSQQEMDEFTKRRQNIESVLGQMGPKRAADGRMRYTVRLGDTLKSIAMKHPALEDVSSWRLLAELNNLSTDTDANDNPKAIVPRGSVLMIPTKFEVEEHKRKMGLRKAIVLPGQSVTTGSALPALKHCPNCGQKSLHTATLCDCGSEFVTDSLPASSDQAHPSAPYLVGAESHSLSQESTNSFLTGQPVKKEDRFDLAVKSGHVDGDHWSDIANLDPETRIVKMNSIFDPSLEFSLLLLQALVAGRWLPVAGYEMREDAAIRIDYTDAKSRSTVKIDLPPSAAQDLAKNDLVKNWQNYKRKFVTILPQQGSAKIND